jgi:hypothetical protein
MSNKIVSYLSLELLELESVKVGKTSTGLAGLQLLGPVGLVPGVDSIVLLKALDKSSLASSTGKTLEDERSQSKTSERVGLTSDTSGGTVNQSTAVINNVDNDSELTAVLTVVDKDETADLNLTLE